MMALDREKLASWLAALPFIAQLAYSSPIPLGEGMEGGEGRVVGVQVCMEMVELVVGGVHRSRRSWAASTPSSGHMALLFAIAKSAWVASLGGGSEGGRWEGGAGYSLPLPVEAGLGPLLQRLIAASSVTPPPPSPERGGGDEGGAGRDAIHKEVARLDAEALMLHKRGLRPSDLKQIKLSLDGLLELLASAARRADGTDAKPHLHKVSTAHTHYIASW